MPRHYLAPLTQTILQDENNGHERPRPFKSLEARLETALGVVLAKFFLSAPTHKTPNHCGKRDYFPRGLESV